MFLENSRGMMVLILTAVSTLQDSVTPQNPLSLLAGTISVVTPRSLEAPEQPD
jgi:hypothetical protein